MKRIFLGNRRAVMAHAVRRAGGLHAIRRSLHRHGRPRTRLKANVRSGFVQLGPADIPQTWDWCSGYNYADDRHWFGHTHLSGTGIGDLNDISLMPVVGEVTPGRGRPGDPSSGMWSRFSRADERCAPGYYATRLLRGIGVELTASPRVGMSR